jgi:hypothetical protein
MARFPFLIGVRFCVSIAYAEGVVVTDYDVDVLVAGAGPVGLVAALLARWGVSVRLVDAAAGPATTSRALGTHARSLEIYDQLGILADIAPHGTKVNAFIRHQGTRTARVDYDFGDLVTLASPRLRRERILQQSGPGHRGRHLTTVLAGHGDDQQVSPRRG